MAELLYMAPPPSKTEPIEATIRQALKAVPLVALDIRTVRIGRSWEVMIHAQLGPDTEMNTHAAMSVASAWRPRWLAGMIRFARCWCSRTMHLSR